MMTLYDSEMMTMIAMMIRRHRTAVKGVNYVKHKTWDNTQSISVSSLALQSLTVIRCTMDSLLHHLALVHSHLAPSSPLENSQDTHLTWKKCILLSIFLITAPRRFNLQWKVAMRLVTSLTTCFPMVLIKNLTMGLNVSKFGRNFKICIFQRNPAFKSVKSDASNYQFKQNYSTKVLQPSTHVCAQQFILTSQFLVMYNHFLWPTSQKITGFHETPGHGNSNHRHETVSLHPQQSELCSAIQLLFYLVMQFDWSFIILGKRGQKPPKLQAVWHD